jgi:hypothetical protein
MWEPQHLTTLLASTLCCRDSFSLLFYKPYCQRNFGEPVSCGTNAASTTEICISATMIWVNILVHYKKNIQQKDNYDFNFLRNFSSWISKL